MNIYAIKHAKDEWEGLLKKERARTLAATYFAPSALAYTGHENDRDAEYKKKAINAIVLATDLQEYCDYWQKFSASFPPESCRIIDATLQTRLLVNLSGCILENAGLAMEHICGVPIIPGSAVKGAARRYAIALMQECDNAQKEELLDCFIQIFGCVEADFSPESDLSLAVDSAMLNDFAELYGKKIQGRVHFLQAVPKSSPALCADVLTPHHREYMEGKRDTPTDDEEPSPSYFPAVQGGNNTIYSFLLSAPGHSELLDTAEEWLTKAITLFGIGAKNAAGYGFFSVPDKALQGFSPEEQEAIRFITEKKKLDDMFKAFHKGKEKEPLRHWALLRAISLPGDDPCCRLNDFRDFLAKEPTEKVQIKAKKKALEAMREMAAAYNINLPDIS